MKRIEQKEKTRQLLLKVAYDEFASKGILQTKTLDIAKAANISHGALFLHYPTRDDLVAAVVDVFGLTLGNALKQSVKTKNAAEVLAIHLSVIREFEPFYAHLVIEGPSLPSSIRSRVFMIQGGIGHYLEKALSNNSVSKTPLHFLLNSWLGVIHYYLANRDLFAPEESVIAVCGEEILGHFIKTFEL